jgi:WD40 repeat protein
MVAYTTGRSMLKSGVTIIILAFFLSPSGLAAGIRGPLNSVSSVDAEITSRLDLGNPEVEQTAVTIAKDYPGEYNLNQVAEVYDALRKGWYYYSDPSYQDKYKHANCTLQDGKISNSIGVGDCDDFAILMASLLEALQGSTRIVFAYDQDTRKNHAYAEVYLGKKSDPRADSLIGWLKDQYSQTDIPGQTVSGDEVWLNLDYNSTFPGGLYFGEGHRVQREVVWQSASRNSPKIVPIVDTMDNIAGWEKMNDENGSTISFSTVPSLKGKAVQMDFDLKEGGWTGMSRNVSGSMLSEANGLNLSYYGLDKQISFQLRLVCKDSISFGYSWKPEPGNKWAYLEALFEDFTRIGLDNNDSTGQRLDPNKVDRLEIVCQLDEKDLPGTGKIIIDQIRGVMNIPIGSPWARAEVEREVTIAKDLAYKSEQAMNIPGILSESVKLAVESLGHHNTLEGDMALRHGLALLPCCLAQLQHNGSVSEIAFSSDGSKLATASYDNTARIWDVKTGAELQRLKHDGSVSSVAFSPNGHELAMGSGDGTAHIWDMITGEELQRLKLNGSVWSIAFSPDGLKVATGSDDQTARIWDVQSGAELQRCKHEDWVESVAFSPDGHKLATGSWDGTARIWDVQTGAELHRLNHEAPVYSVIFSSDSLRVATGSDDNIARIWDVLTGVEIRELIQDAVVHSVAFSPDGLKLATGSGDKTARIWDMLTGVELRRLNHDGSVESVAFSPDGLKLATGSSDNTARIWNVQIDAEQHKLNHDKSVNSIAFSPDGSKLATGSGDKTARIWDVQTGSELQKLKQDYWVWSVAFSPDGLKLATANYDGSVRIWDVQNGSELQKLKQDYVVRSVAFSPDGLKLATGSADNTARIWDTVTGAELHTLKQNDVVQSVAFSPDGLKLATGSWDGTARIWDVATGMEWQRFNHDKAVLGVAFSPDGLKLATAGGDRTARIWDVLTGMELRRLNHDGPVESVAFRFDQLNVATASHDNTARIWDVQTGTELQRFNHDGPVYSVAFSPDGRKLATASGDKTARIWMILSQDLICEACSRLRCNLTSKEWREEYCGKCIETKLNSVN